MMGLLTTTEVSTSTQAKANPPPGPVFGTRSGEKLINNGQTPFSAALFSRCSAKRSVKQKNMDRKFMQPLEHPNEI